MKRIKDVFASYCDAYIEYMNNFLTVDYFCEFYDISENEFMKVHDIVQTKIKRYNLQFFAIDYYMSIETNKGKITFEND